MLRHQILVAIRYLSRNRIYSAINIFGLAIGLAASTVIFSWIHHEYSYDRHHEKLDRIYCVIRETPTETGLITYASETRGRLGSALKTRFPEIEEVVRLYPGWGYSGAPWLSYKDRAFQQSIFLSDPNIFRVFTLPLVRGDPETALLEPNAIVLTAEAATRFFGSEDPMGETIRLDRKRMWAGDFQVTGVLATIPSTSSYPFPFDLLTSTVPSSGLVKNSWEEGLGPGGHLQTFILLKEGVNVSAFKSRLGSFRPPYFPDWVGDLEYLPQPLSRTWLYTTTDFPNIRDYPVHQTIYGSARSLLFLGSIGALVLLVACINFVNLTTARATRRALEVGLRKTVGAGKGHLVRQHLLESVLVTMISGALAYVLTMLAPSIIPDLELTTDKVSALALLCVTCLIIGLCAGAYPAFYVSSFSPLRALRGTGSGAPGRLGLRSSLVLAQFAIAVFLLIGTIVISNQMAYVQSKDLGYAREHVVVTDIFRAHPERTLLRQFDTVKQEFSQHQNVVAVTGSYLQIGSIPEGSHPVRPERASEPFRMQRLGIDADFPQAMDLKLLRGQHLGLPETSGVFNRWEDDAPPVHVPLNQTAVNQLKWSDDPIGKTFTRGPITYIVAGVVEDFHRGSLHHPIRPTYLFQYPRQMKGLLIRIKGEDTASTMTFLRDKWSQFIPGKPPDFTFLEDDIAIQYRSEHQTGRLMTIFATLANIIGCLGLIGLVAFEVEQRVKEVGIRRVLGASTKSILSLFTSKFAGLILIANFIAWPVAWFVMNNWLERFAYRIDLGPGTFAMSAAIALVVASATICVQALRAAMARPVEALRDA